MDYQLFLTDFERNQIKTLYGVDVTHLSKHAMDRMADRGFSAARLVECLLEGKSSKVWRVTEHGLTLRVSCRGVTIVIGKNGAVVTIVAKNDKQSHKFKRKLKNKYYDSKQ